MIVRFPACTCRVKRFSASGSSSASILLATTICGFAANPASNRRSSSWIVSKSSIGSRPDAPGDVDEVHEYLGALDVSQESIAESVTFVRPLDQARDVGDDEATVVAQADDTQVGREGGEGIVRDLGAGRRDSRDQRGFSRIGKADQADVSEQLELEAEELLFTALTRLGASRRAIGGADEASVAATTAASARHEHALPFLREIGEQTRFALVLLVHERADGHRHVEVVRTLSCSIGSLAVLATPCLEVGVKAEVDEGVLRGDGGDVNRAARSSIATVWPAARHELLAAKAQAAIATGSGDDVDVDFVDEHRARALLLDRDDRDFAAVLTVILEAYLAGDLREEGVILPESDIQAGFETTALLPHENGSACHEIAVMPLHAQPL